MERRAWQARRGAPLQASDPCLPHFPHTARWIRSLLCPGPCPGREAGPPGGRRGERSQCCTGPGHSPGVWPALPALPGAQPSERKEPAGLAGTNEQAVGAGKGQEGSGQRQPQVSPTPFVSPPPQTASTESLQEATKDRGTRQRKPDPYPHCGALSPSVRCNLCPSVLFQGHPQGVLRAN